MISPDGRWLAYMSDESGREEVYVRALAAKENKTQISSNRGGYPAWSQNERELLFWQYGPDARLMVVPYRVQGDSFLPDPPRPWSQKRLIGFSTTRSYDPLPDGKSVIGLVPVDSPEPPQDRLIFLLNFFDELRRRVDEHN